MHTEKKHGVKLTRESLTLVLKGFCMGTADVIPGVSGGTMAFILGIYRELIDAIKSFDQFWLGSVLKFDVKNIIARPHFSFLVPLFLGIILALLFFTRVLPLYRLLIEYPEQVYGLFFGLIAGYCVVMIKDMKQLAMKDILIMVAGVISGLIVFSLGTISMPDTALYVYISGCIAISAMLLPGISGSFILLILNKYAFIFNAIGYFQMSVIIPFAAGMLTGLVIFSRFLSWLLHHYLRNTTLVIIGILISSLWIMWPFQNRVFETINDKQKLISTTPVLPGDFDSGFYICLILVICGIVLVMLIDLLGKKNLNHK
jgi:putative membrane protein